MNIGTLILNPLTSAHLAVRHTEGHMAVQSATSLVFIEKKKKTVTATFLIFFCHFLDSRKKKQNREGSHISLLKCPGFQKKKKETGKKMETGIYNLFSL